MTDFQTSFVRTFTPIFAGLISYFVVRGYLPFLSEGDAAVMAPGIASMLYYTGARIFEKKFPKAGYLLGAPRQPEYQEK